VRTAGALSPVSAVANRSTPRTKFTDNRPDVFFKYRAGRGFRNGNLPTAFFGDELRIRSVKKKFRGATRGMMVPLAARNAASCSLFTLRISTTSIFLGFGMRRLDPSRHPPNPRQYTAHCPFGENGSRQAKDLGRTKIRKVAKGGWRVAREMGGV